MKWKLWIIYTPFPFIFYNEWQIIFYFISIVFFQYNMKSTKIHILCNVYSISKNSS